MHFDELRAFIIDHFQNSDSYQLACALAKTGHKGVYLVTQPGFSEKAIVDRTPAVLASIKIIKKTYDEIVKILEAQNGFRIVQQPADTVCYDMYTSHEFITKTPKEDGAEDLRHMGAEFGAKVIEQLTERKSNS